MTRAAAWSPWFAGFAVVAALLAALAYRFRVVSLGPAFATYGLALLSALIGMALAVLSLFVTLTRSPRAEWTLARPAIALLLCVAVLAVPISLFLLNRGSGGM